MILYHNNRCSKSREALKFLEERGHVFEVVHYLEQPLNLKQLRDLMRKLNIDSPRAMMRTKEELYRELALDQADDEALLEAIARYPVLLERPILEKGEKAVIGRPLENLLSIA